MLVSILGDIVVFMNSKKLKLYDDTEEDIEMHDANAGAGENHTTALQNVD